MIEATFARQPETVRSPAPRESTTTVTFPALVFCLGCDTLTTFDPGDPDGCPEVAAIVAACPRCAEQHITTRPVSPITTLLQLLSG